MLDGQQYYQQFPDESPEGPEAPPRLLLSEELRVTLAVIEKELSAFIRSAEADDASVVADDDNLAPQDSAATRDSAAT